MKKPDLIRCVRCRLLYLPQDERKDGLCPICAHQSGPKWTAYTIDDKQRFICPYCGYGSDHPYRYCPDCGTYIGPGFRTASTDTASS